MDNDWLINTFYWGWPWVAVFVFMILIDIRLGLNMSYSRIALWTTIVTGALLLFYHLQKARN